jgi:hypothetical protein
MQHIRFPLQPRLQLAHLYSVWTPKTNLLLGYIQDNLYPISHQSTSVFLLGATKKNQRQGFDLDQF